VQQLQAQHDAEEARLAIDAHSLLSEYPPGRAPYPPRSGGGLGIYGDQLFGDELYGGDAEAVSLAHAPCSHLSHGPLFVSDLVT
tara:strand:- start:141 stop:392 length:252 start_codon:yes stop_codon:yes gene_type:complete